MVTATSPTHPFSELVFWTLGGQMVLFEPVVSLKNEHLKQENTEHNQALWSLHPVGSTVEELHRQMKEVKEELSTLQNWDGKQPEISKALACGSQIAAALGPVARYLALVEGYAAFAQDKELASSNFVLPTPPEETLKARKEANAVEALGPLLTRLEKKKDSANEDFKAGNFLGALRKYWEAIVELCPWTASSLLFLPWDAYRCKLPDLEATLWLNMAMTARRRCAQLPDTEGPNMALKMRWLTFGVDCASQVIDSRFVSRRSLAKAYDYISDVQKTLIDIPTFAQVLGDRLESFKASAPRHAQIAALVQKSEARNPSSPWAHDDCVFDHSGCGCDLKGFEKLWKESLVSPRSRKNRR